MFNTECNHFDVINQAISGRKDVDEETFSSVAVLAERLDRLKKANHLFDEVDFSEQVEELATCEMISAIS
ncbi:MAG: hypothetical protein ACYTFK_03220 [Planctomycetota bacterium]|jgi:hypothetical protein